MSQELNNYIAQSLASGGSRESITQLLMQSGWLKEDIDRAFIALTTPPAPVGVITPNYALEGPNSVLPFELRGWNWGAFLLNWIWAIGNSTWIGLLMFVPIVQFIMPFVLGAKGNEWAWKNRHFESIEQFKTIQRKWAQWGVAFLVVQLLVFGLLTGSVVYQLQTARQKAIDVAVKNANVTTDSSTYISPAPVSTFDPSILLETVATDSGQGISFKKPIGFTIKNILPPPLASSGARLTSCEVIAVGVDSDPCKLPILPTLTTDSYLIEIQTGPKTILPSWSKGDPNLSTLTSIRIGSATGTLRIETTYTNPPNSASWQEAFIDHAGTGYIFNLFSKSQIPSQKWRQQQGIFKAFLSSVQFLK